MAQKIKGKPIRETVRDFRSFLGYGKSASTAISYSGTVRKFLLYVSKDPADITPLDITRWFDHLQDEGYSPRTLNHYGWALKAFFDFKGNRDLENRTPIMEYSAPEPKWMTEHLAFELIAQVPCLCVGYDLALRIGECGLLRKSGFNPDTGDITVIRLKHKNQRNRYILRISDWCLPILNRWIRDHARGDIIFPQSVSTIRRRFIERARHLNLEDYSFHSLRHSKITHLAIRDIEERGMVDELKLSKFAGHLRVETTRTYVHLALEHLTYSRARQEPVQRRKNGT